VEGGGREEGEEGKRKEILFHAAPLIGSRVGRSLRSHEREGGKGRKKKRKKKKKLIFSLPYAL